MIQRPVLITDGAAIIGRPKDRVVPFLTAHS
jgi:arsenate reductase-like glutaredoxin family protein